MSAAFFDIDGTLLPKPSLERRFFWHLLRCGKIPAANCGSWIAQTIRFGWRDFRRAAQANKIYLRGLSSEVLCGSGRPPWLPEFFPMGVERAWRHALRGDSLVLVSGTLAPLAEIVKLALERELLRRGSVARVSVIATEVEMSERRSTGRVAGLPVFAEGKACAVRSFANTWGIALGRSSAYGDSSFDRWMLASVGHPFATNPSRRLLSTARFYGWPVLSWRHPSLQETGETRTPQTQGTRLGKKS